MAVRNSLSILSVLVNNEIAVLTRVSSLLARRGFDINSLVVGETQDSAVSRMTITFQGDEQSKDQVVKQLAKLRDVLKVELMESSNTVARELLLIKVHTSNGKRNEIVQAASVFRANVVELAPDSVTMELTGETAKIDAFIELLKPYGVAELCRTGATALGRGKHILN